MNKEIQIGLLNGLIEEIKKGNIYISEYENYLKLTSSKKRDRTSCYVPVMNISFKNMPVKAKK